ncbi:hypothetical protein ACQPZF_05835 [Actinosynnema sp. CS-041913]
MAKPAGRVIGRWRIVEMDTLTGHLFLHLGEDSGFRATPFPGTRARGER